MRPLKKMPKDLQRHLITLLALSFSLSLFACSEEDSAAESFADGTYRTSDNLPPPPPPGNTDYDDVYAEAGSAAGADFADEIEPELPSDEELAGGVEEPTEELPEVNPEVDSAEDNLITFAVDVDTASYAYARASLRNGSLPSPVSVRTEEFVNYFDYYDAPPPSAEEGPFAVSMEVAPSPFGEGRQLMRVGVKGYEVDRAERPAANLVFLLDVSGSMNSDNKLGLVKQSMSLMLDNLNGTDTVAIVTYAGADRVVLEPTEATERDTIINAINSLESGGSTNGAAGITTAYRLAEQSFVTGGINRVILCTDGDFNVGVTGQALYNLIEEKRETGVTISVFGFGMRGGYNDGQMEEISNRGNGNYAFIDTLAEAQRALVDKLTAAIFTIAKDVKLQLEVNPFLVKTHRLLGYENRAIADDDFRDDTVDAGEIGAGHTVTALIELQPYAEGEAPSTESLADREIDAAFYEPNAPLSVLRIRSKAPDATTEDAAKEQRFDLSESDVHASIDEASQALRFGAAVAELAEILRHSPYAESADFDAISSLAQGAIINQDPLMQEFLEVVELARGLWR